MMGGKAVWRYGGRCIRFAALLTAVPAFRLTAQVGHDPSHSPYHDIRRGTGPRLVFWKLRYPIKYKTPLSPDGTTVLPLFAKETDWTIHPWVSLGVGWTF